MQAEILVVVPAYIRCEEKRPGYFRLELYVAGLVGLLRRGGRHLESLRLILKTHNQDLAGGQGRNPAPVELDPIALIDTYGWQ